MIKNKFVQSFLLNAGSLLDWKAAQPINTAFRLLYRALLPKIIRFKLRRFDPTIIGRHSVYESHFNLCFSDFDFSTLANDPDSFREIALELQQLRLKFPFIGEAEIYTPSEYNRMNEIRKTDSDFFSLFHQIRKLSWSKRDYENAPSEYHRYKMMRAHDILLKKLNLGAEEELGSRVENFLRAQFSEELAELDRKDYRKLNVYSLMLGIWVGSDLTPSAAHLLLALMPGSFEHPEDLQLTLRNIREQFPRVRLLWSHYNEYEQLMFTGFCRSQLERTQSMVDWTEKLANECK